MVRLRVHRLEFRDFRNYAAAEFLPGPQINLLLGPNGAGKSNVLEALHLLVTGLSPRAGRDLEMVRWGRESFSVRGEVEEADFPGDVLAYQVTYIEGRGKRVLRAGKARTGRARSAALGGAVVFSPDDLALVKGSPGRRRSFLDLVAAKSIPGARTTLRRYERTVGHRNRLLTAIAGGRAGRTAFSELQAWTEQLVELATELLQHRLEVCVGLAAPAAGAYSALGGNEQLTVEYDSPVFRYGRPIEDRTVLPRQALTDLFKTALRMRRDDELARGTTLIGPHRDDLQLILGAAAARLYASQGQQRTIALALRLAETQLLRTARGEEPLLLLDDVFSELDAARRQALVAAIGSHREVRQTFITATDSRGLPAGVSDDADVFAVKGGTITRG